MIDQILREQDCFDQWCSTLDASCRFFLRVSKESDSSHAHYATKSVFLFVKLGAPRSELQCEQRQGMNDGLGCVGAERGRFNPALDVTERDSRLQRIAPSHTREHSGLFLSIQ